MKLVKRYVYDVVRRLPENQRSEVSRELMTEIQEMIEDRSGNGVPKKATEREVLSELGSPGKFADKYREKPRYIIGPEDFEAYVTLLKTVFLVVIPLVAFIVFMNELMSVNHSPLSFIFKILGILLEVGVHIFFWTTASFVIVQKITGKDYEADWTPDELPDLSPEQGITRSESYLGIAWSIFAVIATLYQVPMIYKMLAPENVPQFFSEDMWPGWTLGLLAISLLGLFVEIIKLKVGGWTKMTVGLISVANVLSISFFLLVVQYVRPIANPELLALITESLGREKIGEYVTQGIRIFVYLVVIMSVYEIGEAIYKYRKGAK